MDPSEKILKILNVYTIFYNNINGTNEHLFSGIDHEDNTSTNSQLEKLYECMYEYRNCDPQKINLLDPHQLDINKIKQYDELYGLKNNGNLIKVCQILFPILEYVATFLDYENDNWEIIEINHGVNI